MLFMENESIKVLMILTLFTGVTFTFILTYRVQHDQKDRVKNGLKNAFWAFLDLFY